jgi:predicted dehydrogenase
MTDQPLRIGIVGAGGMGTRHAAAWSRVPGVTVTGVADINHEKARKLASQHDAVGHDSASALLDDANANVDIISMCVPTSLHRELCVEALQAGKHVFCEKPMALTVADCDAMIAAAKAAGKLLSIGQVVRFFPEYANAKRLIDSGAVGKPAVVRVRRGGGFPHTDTNWFADPAQSGGVVYDLLVHEFDWLLWCFGPVKRVYARSLTERMAAGEFGQLDYALVTLRHESGVVSHAEGTWADPGGFATSFEVAGDGGLLSHDSRKATPLVRSLRREGQVGPGVPLPSSPLAAHDNPYYREIAAFAKSVREGTPLAVTAEEGRAAIAVAQAAAESARTGQAVELT